MDSLLGLRSTVEKKALAYLPGAHHGLEIDGDVPGSVRLMERIVEAVEEFVREGLLPERSS